MALFANSLSSFKNKLLSSKAIRSSIGLDIGVGSCRMVEVTRRPDGYELAGFAIEPIINGDIVKSIRAVMSKAREPNLSPVSALMGKGTLIRFVDMPKMSLVDLKRSFAYEVDKYFPFPKDQIFTDCHILDPQGVDNKLPVLVAAAKKELVNERIKLINDAGLQADFITLNSIAIANVFDVLGGAQNALGGTSQNKKAIAILDVGEIVSNLTILVDNRPKFNRDIFIGGRDFTKSISSALRVSFEEAEKIKQDPKERASEIAGCIESVAFDLVSELRLSFDYFITETNLSLGMLFLAGGGTSVEALQKIFSKQLEVEVLPWNPFSLMKLATGISSQEINAKAGYLGCALGLALYS